jgi:hypothetical protein
MYGTSPIELLAADAMLRGAINCNSYVYPADFLAGTQSAIPATSTPVNVPIQITSEADFVCQRVTAIAWSAVGTLLQDPDFTLQIAISSGRPWFNSAISVRNIAGMFAAAETPFSLTFPRLIPLNSTLTITVVNRTAAAPNLFEILLQGYNVYYKTETRDQVFHVL